MNKVILYFIPLIISSILIFFAHNSDLWQIFWSFFKVPAQTIPFGDLDFILKAVTLKKLGFNPYLENPMNIRYVYPSIWLYFFEILKLDEYINFRIFNFIIIYIYVYIYLNLIFKFNNIYITIILIFLFFSSANLLAIERLNIEIIIFSLVYIIALTKNNIIRSAIFILSIYSKIYPIFSVFIFSKNIKFLFIMICISLLVLFHIKNDILFLTQYGNEVALNIAYGIPTLTKGIWYYSTKFGYLINDNNYNVFKYSIIILTCIYAFLIMLLSYRFRNKITSASFNLDEKLFICGAGIFIGRFIFSSNFDYSFCVWINFFSKIS